MEPLVEQWNATGHGFKVWSCHRWIPFYTKLPKTTNIAPLMTKLIFFRTVWRSPPGE